MGSFKDITGQHFGHLTALYPTEKRQGTNIIWCFQCDCGNFVERTTCHIPDDAACSACNPKGAKLRKDYTGMRFGNLVAQKCIGKGANNEYIWLLHCNCGKDIELPVSHFVSGNTKSCGCLRQNTCRDNSRFENLVGERFGKLTVEAQDGRDRSGHILWSCKCDCGNSTLVTTSELRDGKKWSCGCDPVEKYCVFKHVFPDGRVYVGLTANAPWSKWTSGTKYRNQHAMKMAIDEIGGFQVFLNNCTHFYFSDEKQWERITGPMPYSKTNLFSKEEANSLKQAFIKEYRALDPLHGLNAASGCFQKYYYSDSAKQRQSNTRTGKDSQKDWRVYVHKNNINQKVYVGITCQDPEKRWANGNGYKSSSKYNMADGHFYHAIKKYGWDNFEHVVVKTHLSHREANELEMQLIAEYDSTNPEKGYNLTRGGDGSQGFSHTKEAKERLSRKAKARKNPFKGKHHTPKAIEKMSASHKGQLKGARNPQYGKQKTAEEKQKMAERSSKAVDQYSLDGVFIRRFRSGKEAAEALDVTPAAISAAVCGKSKTCHGFIWKSAK